MSLTVAVAQHLLHFLEVEAMTRNKPAQDANLSFWGGGSRSIIGETFAMLYLHRVERVVLGAPFNRTD